MGDMRRLANKNNSSSSSSVWGGTDRENGQERERERAQLQPKQKLPHQCAHGLSYCTLCFCMAARI